MLEDMTDDAALWFQYTPAGRLRPGRAMRPEDIPDGATSVGTSLRYPTRLLDALLTALSERDLGPDLTTPSGTVSFLFWDRQLTGEEIELIERAHSLAGD